MLLAAPKGARLNGRDIHLRLVPKELSTTSCFASCLTLLSAHYVRVVADICQTKTTSRRHRGHTQTAVAETETTVALHMQDGVQCNLVA